MKILVLKDKAIDQYNSGFLGLNAITMIEFEKSSHAEYFKEHYNGKCNDYKEFMPSEEDVHFTMHYSYQNKLVKDKMFKPKKWKLLR